MSKDDYPITPAVRFMREKKAHFVPHIYSFEEHGGTKHTSLLLKVPEHHVVKTLIMETDQKKPFIILMHGDCEVSTKQLARSMGVKQVVPCDAATAHRLTGYQFGGTSPFGTRTQLPVYVEKTILDVSRIYINGGKRGFIMEIESGILARLLSFIIVEAAISTHP